MNWNEQNILEATTADGYFDWDLYAELCDYFNVDDDEIEED